MCASTADTILAIVGLAALFVSIVALYFAVTQGKAQLKQLEYASVPALVTEVHYQGTSDGNFKGLAFRNNGNGSAIIESVKIYYRKDENHISTSCDCYNWIDNFLAELQAKHQAVPPPFSFVNSYVRKGAVIAAGRISWVVYQKIEPKVAIPTGTLPPEFVDFDTFLKNLDIEVVYKSLYGHFYTTAKPYNADGNYTLH